MIEQSLLQLAGVVEVSVSVAAQRARVAAPARELRQTEQRSALWRLFVAGFCMMQVMMLAAPSYVAGSGELTPDLARLLNWGSWAATGIDRLATLAVAAHRAAHERHGAARRGHHVCRHVRPVPFAATMADGQPACSVALRRTAPASVQRIAFVAALATVGYIVGAAWTRSATLRLLQ